MYLYSNTTAGLLFAETVSPLDKFSILDNAGNAVDCPALRSVKTENGWKTTIDASNLAPWSPDSPVLYTFSCEEETLRFGHVTMEAVQNKALNLNGSPVYLRGYIRGITAHDHPNMTGGTIYDAAVKNIRQAKKYGFNLVRFHSTIPTEEFVNAADELGLLIHMEIGFSYDYDNQGNKTNLSTDNVVWRETICKYRNHPSMAIFCIGNEMHNSGHYPQVRKMYDEGRKLAPNKLIMDNSGWGEFDRQSADVFSQHIAYYFPFKHHGRMFLSDEPWRMNGSSFDAPIESDGETSAVSAHIHRQMTPIRPTLSHEAMHYIDIPDYDAMNAKFDAFAEKVGKAYMEQYGIKKPRFLTELPRLIREKGLTEKMPDYIAASRQWKLLCTKVFLERLRLSPLCGYEMLQLSDTLKYENKNGIIDCFDDDKGIDPDWLKQSNDDLVLLADMDTETWYEDSPIPVEIFASDFLPAPEIRGTLTVSLDGELLYEGRNFILAGGLQKLAALTLNVKSTGKAVSHTLSAVFTAEGVEVRNSWPLWVYPRRKPAAKPVLGLADEKLAAYLANGTPRENVYLTDTFDEKVFENLAAGKTTVLLYEYKAERNEWQMPGALERFKPCIWDRGSNLGGIFYSERLQKALASGRYFDLNMQPLLEAGWKVNLDHFPCAVTEYIAGIDKPVRDRMKGLLHNVKDFIADDTLRKFAHLFSVKVGNGTLVICTFRLTDLENPVVSNFVTELVDNPEQFTAETAISAEAFRAWLEQVKAEGLKPEDVMNHFWEIDNKPVEDTLFWEEANVNLAESKKDS